MPPIHEHNGRFYMPSAQGVTFNVNINNPVLNIVQGSRFHTKVQAHEQEHYDHLSGQKTAPNLPTITGPNNSLMPTD